MVGLIKYRRGQKDVKIKWQIFMGTVLLFVTTVAVATPKAEILEYGYYEFSTSAKRSAHPATTSGFVQTGEAQLVKQAERIPIEQGRLFGFRFIITGMDPNIGQLPLELVVTHPKMEKPDGTSSTGYRYTLGLVLNQGVVEDKTGYRMSEKYEMVEGDWVFEYLFMNSPLMVQRFTTYKP